MLTDMHDTLSGVCRLIRLSCNHASAVVAELRGALKRHSVERISARVRRHSLRPALTASLPRNISVAHTGAGDGESDESAASDSGDEMEQDSAELKQQPVSIKKEPSSSPQGRYLCPSHVYMPITFDCNLVISASS